MSQRTPAESERQPKTYRLSAKALLSLPFRLCNPPPAVGKVRSCGVTPVFKVRLADVLDRKHLPPLGLKDFEEWLLYVEMSPENLYFILWLREYTIKYRQWEAASKSRRQEVPVYLGVWPSHNSTQLAMFYARAKQTFLTPNANYELNLPSDVLAPFHTSNGSPHPDPAVFNNVAVQVQKMLDESLQRFVTAQFNNVGNNRVLCGMMAGIFCCLVGALFPLLFTILRGHSRWLRLTAFPGLWLGFSLLITSINGICLGVYIFGDLRQLRKFELSRPAISRPQPFYSSRRTPVAAMSINRPLSEDTPMEEGVVGSDGEGSIRSASTSSEEMSCDIQISPAYYDMDPVEGPAVSPISYTEKNQSGSDSDSEVDYPATALFIHPFDDSSCDDMSTCDTPQSTSFPSPRDKKRLPEEMQRVSEFDFGALPRKQGTVLPTLPPPQIEEAAARIIVVPAAAEDNGISPKAFIRRLQARCNIKRWLVVSEHSPPAADGFISKQFKKVKAVPAFASPLTKILSPVVVRGQWEIVVRSMVMAFLLAWIVIGCLLAVPAVSY